MQNQTGCQVKDWNPQRLVNGEEPIAIIILNQALSNDVKLFIKERWKSAVFRVAVDGGAYQLMITPEFLNLVPDLICGDFDSISSETLDYYKKMDVHIVHTPDQDETDFTKALTLTLDHLKENKLKVSAILAVAQNSGRLDHTLGNINTLYKFLDITSIPVIILGDNSMTWLLASGSHQIHISDSMKGSHIGLIPLGEPCEDICTTGLEWNLSHDKMQFGGLISTSNKFEECDIATISTDKNLIWTMEINLANICAEDM